MTATTRLFSVIIPTHGRPAMLAEAISSVQAQTITDWECIVAVDGGEAPPTPPDQRIRVVIRDRNGGAAAARNTGIEHSSGANIAFLDDDDTWLPDRLEIALEGLSRAPVAACYGLTGDELGWEGTWEGDVSDTILDNKAPSVNGLAIRRDALVTFDERFRGAEDVEWLIRLASNAPFATVPRAGFVRGNAGTGRVDALPRLDGVNLLLVEHADYFASHPIAAARCWNYYGEASLRAGQRTQSRRAYLRALRYQPTKAGLQTLLETFRKNPS